MSPRVRRFLDWSGVIALIGLLVTVVTASIGYGRHESGQDGAISGKLDSSVYQQGQTALERRLGELQGDLRVIRAFVCRRDPGACR